MACVQCDEDQCDAQQSVRLLLVIERTTLSFKHVGRPIGEEANLSKLA
jgi:hypothetical protein